MDSRTINSFVCIGFITKSRIACEKADSVLEVTIPLGKIFNTNQIAMIR